NWIRITCRLRPMRRGCLPELLLETRHEHVEFRGDRADSIRLTEIYACACEKVHWIIAAARFQQIEVSAHGVVALPPVARADALHEPRGGREARRILIDVVGRAEEVRDARPRHARHFLL